MQCLSRCSERFQGSTDVERCAELMKGRAILPFVSLSQVKSNTTLLAVQVHYQGKVGSAPAVAATFEAPEADDEPPRGRHSDVRTRHNSPEHDSRAKAAPDQRQGSEARLDRGREPGGALGRFAGRITSQVVGFERCAVACAAP